MAEMQNTQLKFRQNDLVGAARRVFPASSKAGAQHAGLGSKQKAQVLILAMLILGEVKKPDLDGCPARAARASLCKKPWPAGPWR